MQDSRIDWPESLMKIFSVDQAKPFFVISIQSLIKDEMSGKFSGKRHQSEPSFFHVQDNEFGPRPHLQSNLVRRRWGR